MFNPLENIPSVVIDAAAKTRLLVLDVDGVLTNGQVTYTSDGVEIKTFNIKDGLGIKLLQKGGVEVAIITGRSSAMVARRAQELGIELLVQSREDKWQALQELMVAQNYSAEQIAYMGDDLPDMSAIKAVGLGVTVADGNNCVAHYADFQTKALGGQGAVRELAEIILLAQGKYQALIEQYQ